MSARSLTSLRTLARLGQLSAAACVMVLSAARAEAQSMRASGSIGVSLNILKPVSTETVRLVGFSVDKAGIATLQTTSPVSGPASQVIMSTISSSNGHLEQIAQAPALVRGNGSLDGTSGDVASHDAVREHTLLRYTLNVGPAGAESRPVQVRIQYLAVAGT